MARFLRHVAYWFAGFALGDAARVRSEQRRAVNPARESLRNAIKVTLGIALPVWLLMLGGCHSLFTAFDSAVN